MLTEKELSAMIAEHREKANRFHELWNEEKDIILNVICKNYGWLFEFDKENRKRILKDFFYEMSVYHVNERIKCEIALHELIKRDPETVGRILLH